MKIRVLCENTSKSHALTAEHGLSLFIETPPFKILFDMGQTAAFAENAKVLGVDISAVDFAVLSHGHYDHGGGISAFLAANKKAPLYVNENVFGNYYNGSDKYIGLDKSIAESKNLVLVSDSFDIAEGFKLYSCNERERPYGTNPYGLTESRNGKLCDDRFLHEQYLLAEENGKRILISGCSHKGVLNILHWFKPDVFVGGLHFNKISDKAVLASAAKALLAYGTLYYTCHCTGCEQFEYMKTLMGDRLNYISTGDEVCI